MHRLVLFAVADELSLECKAERLVYAGQRHSLIRWGC